MRIYQIPAEIQDFPGDEIGDNGDVAVNSFTSEVRIKADGEWVTMSTIQQDGGIEWTPSNLNVGEQMGFFAYSNNESLLGVTSLTFTQTTNSEGYDIENAKALTSVSFPNLESITDSGYFQISGCDVLEVVSLPNFTSIDGNRINISSNPSLVNIDLPNLDLTNKALIFNGNALPVSVINDLFVRVAGTSGSVSSRVLQFNQGTNATPSGQGVVALRLALRKGYSIYVNPDTYSWVSSGDFDAISGVINRLSYEDSPAVTLVNANITDMASGFSVNSSGSLTTISFPNLISTGSISAITCPLLTSITLNSLVTVGSDGINCTNSTQLATFSAPAFSPINGMEINFSGCALNLASVNALLARCVSNASFVSGTINVDGGTNAAPTGQGATDKTTLQNRGVTVNTN